MNENINLCELLKGHEGETFYSPLCGDTTFEKMQESNEVFPICISYCQNSTSLTKDGRWWDNGECVLFPSKDQRDWNKWAEEQKHNKLIIPKTWTQFLENNFVDDNYNRIVRVADAMGYEVDYNFTPIENSALALLRIHQLIEVGYGGNITNEEWEAKIYKPCIFVKEGKIQAGEFMTQKHHIAFHTTKQRDEFLSYLENIQLIKDFYQIP